jgi:isoleucyl-tRNA synthetase
LKNAVDIIDNSLTAYNTQTACQALQDFFEVLNNWYIRRSRERFWSKVGENSEKQTAYNTLYTCLIAICKAASPLIPFITEEIYRNLTGKESVHLERFPISKTNNLEEDLNSVLLVKTMDYIRDICNAGLAVRNKENIRVRQPLRSATIIFSSVLFHEKYLENLTHIIKDELNVKVVTFIYDLGERAELKLKINFPILGKRLPDKVKEIIPASKQGKWEQLEDGRIKIAGEILEKEECQLLLEPKNPKGAAALSTNDALVILDLEITEELRQEGLARDVVRLIQQARKDADLNITDRINLSLKLPVEFETSVNNFKDYICEQTLTKNLDLDGKILSKFTNNYPLDEKELVISIGL